MASSVLVGRPFSCCDRVNSCCGRHTYSERGNHLLALFPGFPPLRASSSPAVETLGMRLVGSYMNRCSTSTELLSH